jgi:hypothetical protein
MDKYNYKIQIPFDVYKLYITNVDLLILEINIFMYNHYYLQAQI